MKNRLFSLLLIAAAPVLRAGGTATWEMNNYGDFVRGRLAGVSLDREGRLLLAPRLETWFASEQPIIWSLAQAPDGAIYAGTGHRGRLFRIGRTGEAAVHWVSDQPEIFAVAVDSRGAVYAATSPNGKVFRIENGQASEFFAPNTTYIWSLLFARDGSLFVGTGDQGTIFRVDPSGRAEVYYETGQAHVTCLALDNQGRLLAGTEPNGIIYRIEGRGRAFVLYDASLPEIRALVAAPDGSIYAAAQGGAGMRRALAGQAAATTAPQPPTLGVPVATPSTLEEEAQAGLDLRPRSQAVTPAQGLTPQVTAQFTPASEFAGVERSALYRIRTDNTVESLWSSRDENVYDLVALGDQLLFATDGQGRIYRRAADGKVTLVAQTNEGEATRLLPAPDGILAATGDAGRIYRLGTQTGASGVYESPIHDAGTVARWGRLSWLAETASGTQIVFRTRTGNSMRPDPTWSEWSEPLNVPEGSAITSPNARFIQWKAEFRGAGGNTPVLDSVTVAYVPQNTPPSVKNITVATFAVSASAPRQPAAQAVSTSYSITVSDTGDVPPTSAGTPTQTATRATVRQMQVSWQAEDPDNDRLVFSLYFRGEGEREWKLIASNLQETSRTIDGDALADGRYHFRVVASDHPSNPPSAAREAELVSPPVLVDNTPPLVTPGAIQRSGERAEAVFEAADAASALRRAEYSVDAGPWAPAETEDGILDSQRERLRVRLDKLSPGEHLLVLRVYDAAENAGLAKVVLR